MDIWTILAIILFIVGFVLVGVEMVIPGFSVPGVSGIICLVLAVFLAADTLIEGVVITLIVLALLGIMLAILLSILSKGKLRSPIILKEEQQPDQGYISSNDLKYLLGRKGVALTDLRPTGIGDFDGIQMDVLSEGQYIKKGTELVICKVQGSKLIVKIDEKKLF